MNFIDIISNYCKNNGCNVKIKECLKDYTTFKIGGTCDILVFPKDRETLVGVLKIIKSENADYFILGNGSNVLICENHFNGAVIVTSDMKKCEVTGDNMIYTECGLSLSRLAVIAKENALSGLEFAYGIPGTVGGAVYMNAGAYDGKISDVVFSSDCLDICTLEIKTINNAEHQFAYRDSVFHRGGLIALSTIFSLKKGVKEDIESVMTKNMNARREKQPLEYPSAGSTFKRHGNYFTAKLIEDCGLKGKTVGGAMVSEKHSGFVINKGGATFNDVVTLIEIIKNTVYEKAGISIECEVEIVRF